MLNVTSISLKKRIVPNIVIYITREKNSLRHIIEPHLDSQAKRMRELQGFLCMWKQAKYVIHTDIYFDNFFSRKY